MYVVTSLKIYLKYQHYGVTKYIYSTNNTNIKGIMNDQFFLYIFIIEQLVNNTCHLTILK